MGNTNSGHANSAAQPQQSSGSKASSQPKRPTQTRKRSTIELPDIRGNNKLSLDPSSASRHSRVGSITPLTPVQRGATAPVSSPAPIPIPQSSIQGTIDVGQHLGSTPSSPARFPSPSPASRFVPPAPEPEPAQMPPDPAQRPPALSVQTMPQVTESYVYSSISLGIVLPVAGTSQLTQMSPDANDGLVPTTITWRGGGNTVLLAGTFESSWRVRVPMAPDPDSSRDFSVSLRLAPGNHRLKFIVDDQWRCSDDLPTATDNDGHLVNYIEISNPNSQAWDPSSEPSSPHASRQQTSWGSDIPPHLSHSAWLEDQYLSQKMATPPPIPHPAALPRHLEKVILNAPRHGRDRAVMEGVGDDNSVLPVPNHVVLNHLGTSAIKNGVLAVATSMRYHKKYISTLYFKPASTS